MSKVLVIIASALLIAGLLFFVITMSIYGWNFGRIFGGGGEERVIEIAEDFDDIFIEVNTADIILAPSEDGACRLVCVDKERVIHEASVSGGVLRIGENDQRRWYERIFDFASDKVTLYLPIGAYANIAVNGDTGNVTIPGGFDFDSMSISLDTGDVRIDGSKAGALSVSTHTGDIYVSRVIASGAVSVNLTTGGAFVADASCASFSSEADTGEIYVSNLTATEGVTIKRSTGDVEVAGCTAANIAITTGTGDVDLERATASGRVEIVVSSGNSELERVACAELISRGSTGDVSLEGVIASGKFDIERSTGDVELEDSDASEIYITTGTGDVEGTLLTDKVFITRTSTGYIDVPKTITGGRCEITTTTGHIKIKYTAQS